MQMSRIFCRALARTASLSFSLASIRAHFYCGRQHCALLITSQQIDGCLRVFNANGITTKMKTARILRYTLQFD